MTYMLFSYTVTVFGLYVVFKCVHVDSAASSLFHLLLIIMQIRLQCAKKKKKREKKSQLRAQCQSSMTQCLLKISVMTGQQLKAALCMFIALSS